MTTPAPRDLDASVRDAWTRFRDTYEPLRPELFRYCRHLTRSPWDAEDLVQDTLARAFVTLGMTMDPPANPRAWLFRVASNLWIDRTRQKRELPSGHAADQPEPSTTTGDPRATREAAGTLMSHLSPQERAAIVLKDAFGLSLAEVAEALSTTSGAVKTALHRGRTKLAEPSTSNVAPVAPGVLDAFCDAFNARDLTRLTTLLLDTATVEYPGFKIEEGATTLRDNTLRGTLFGCIGDEHPPDIPVPRCELRSHRGETIMLWWSGDEVHSIVRADVTEDRIARLLNYYHAPEVIEEVCRELDVPFRTHGYRPAPLPS